MMKRILVTGANGFVGRHVVDELLARGHHVRCMIQPGTPAPPTGTAEVVEADLLSPPDLERAVEGTDAIVHLAALVQEWGPRSRFEQVNVGGTRSLAHAAARAGARRFVFMSSLAVHGKGDFVEASEDAPRDPAGNSYAWSKIACENLLMEEHARGRLEAVILRPGWILYGAYDSRTVPALIPLLRKGTMPVCGDESHVTCSVAGPNLAYGVRLALESDVSPGRAFVITDDELLDWGRFFDVLAACIGVPPPRRKRVPYPIAMLAAAGCETAWNLAGLCSRPPLTRYLARLMCRNTHFSCAAARTILRYSPLSSFATSLSHALSGQTPSDVTDVPPPSASPPSAPR